MPDRDDIDPMEEAYLRAEAALDDEAERAARRARVLAAVAQKPEAAPSAPARSPIRRYGPWLAAAGVAGLSVITAEQVYRLSPQKPPSAPAAPAAAVPAQQPSASPPVASQEPAESPTAGKARAAPPQAQSARLARPPPVQLRPPVAPPPDIAPPPPLALPPVQEPIRASPPPQIPAAPAPAPIAPPPPPAPAAKAGAAEPAPNTELQSVVVTGSRIARRDYAPAPPPPPPPPADALISGPLKALGGPARLREAAAAGFTAEITALLDQGVPVDAADENGETALMKSIQANQLDAVVILHRRGASLDLKNRAGVSARDMAAQKNDLSLNEALNFSQ